MGTTDRDVPLRGYVASPAARRGRDRYGYLDRQGRTDADDLDGRGRGSDSYSRLKEGHRCGRGSGLCRSPALRDRQGRQKSWEVYRTLRAIQRTQDINEHLRWGPYEGHGRYDLCEMHYCTDREPYYFEQRDTM